MKCTSIKYKYFKKKCITQAYSISNKNTTSTETTYDCIVDDIVQCTVYTHFSACVHLIHVYKWGTVLSFVFITFWLIK